MNIRFCSYGALAHSSLTPNSVLLFHLLTVFSLANRYPFNFINHELLEKIINATCTVDALELLGIEKELEPS